MDRKTRIKEYVIDCMDCHFHDKDPHDVYGDVDPELELEATADAAAPQSTARTVKHWFFGSLDWRFMCTPQWPYCRTYFNLPPRGSPIFFGRNEWLGFVTALMIGLQHALAMVGGLIVPPTLVVPYGTPDGSKYVAYLVQAALIVTGIMTFFQVTGVRLFGKKGPMWGPGVLSVMGISFTSVPVAQSVIPYLMNVKGYTFPQAYGLLLGTLCVSTLTPFLFAFMPIKMIRKIFPPVVSGVTIMLIGIHLTGAGIANWGGGAYCGMPTNYLTIPCNGNGDVVLFYGDAHYVGLGFLVFVTIIVTEIFGSPFLRNCSAIIGLLLGYIVAAAIDVNGKRYVTEAEFTGPNSPPPITFLWTTTFPLGFYAPALIPLIIVSTITSIETVGDTTATMEASRMPTLGTEYNQRIKGALFNDAVSGVFSALATSLPLTTFAQNNGVISLTNVASRQAGWACAFWLLLLGILGKFGAWVTSIPSCVLGGMTTFLFANIISSGIKIITTQGKLDRRTRFIMAAALALGVGVELYPQWASTWLWPVTPGMSETVLGVRQAVILILTTSFCLAAVTSFILNLIMPLEAVDPGYNKYYSDMEKRAALGLDTTKSFATGDGSSHHTEPSFAPKYANGNSSDGIANKEESMVTMTVTSGSGSAVPPMVMEPMEKS